MTSSTSPLLGPHFAEIIFTSIAKEETFLNNKRKKENFAISIKKMYNNIHNNK